MGMSIGPLEGNVLVTAFTSEWSSKSRPNRYVVTIFGYPYFVMDLGT